MIANLHDVKDDDKWSCQLICLAKSHMEADQTLHVELMDKYLALLCRHYISWFEIEGFTVERMFLLWKTKMWELNEKTDFINSFN